MTRVVDKMGKEDVEQLLNLWEKMVRIMEEDAVKMISDEASDYSHTIHMSFYSKPMSFT